MEKRDLGRAKKRVMVRYGIQKADRAAFTKNLSEDGLCLQTNHVFQPGTTIQVEITLPERTFSMWGRVVWAKKVPPQLAHVVQCGMGIQFLETEPDWVRAVAAWRGSKIAI